MLIIRRLSDHEVEMRLGYTPCVCGVLDGTWHSACYKGKSEKQIQSGHKRAMRLAREQIAARNKEYADAVIQKAMEKKQK